MTTCRVFASTDRLPGPADLERGLAGIGRPVLADHLEEGPAWFHGEYTSEGAVVEVDRWLADEEGVRAELNSWAAAVESWEGTADYGSLMERIVQARQLFILQGKAGPNAEEWCLDLARLLAGWTDGVYQVDGEGFYTADGALLAAEPGGPEQER